MIWHETKRMQPELVLRSALFKGNENGSRCGFVVQIGPALIAADGDEMVALATIELRQEASVSAIDRHTE